MNTRVLTSLGVSEKSAKIYLTGLSLGSTTIQELARKSGLKRPTVYVHVDELMRRGLFEIVPINKKTYYRAVDPEVLENKLKKDLLELQTSLPELLAMQAETLGKPQIRIYEGEEGIRTVYEEVTDTNNLRIWSSLGAHSRFHSSYMDISETIRKKEITTRELSADTKESRRYMRLTAKVSGPTYSVRLATVEGIENDSLIYGNCVALVRLVGHNFFVVRIEDKSIADTMRALFDMAWKSAKPFK